MVVMHELDVLRKQVALQATMGPTQSMGPSGEDMFLRGVELSQRHAAENSDTIFKRFTAAQKTKICGFFGVTSWCRVPHIWALIENTKDEVELKKLMISCVWKSP